MELPLYSVSGETQGTVEVSDTLFNQPMNRALVHQAMVMYQANQRQGTHSAKTRAEVSGGGRKPWPQKHTGRARQGSTRAPQWRKGGVAFGPKPRDYRLEMPRRMRHQALRCVLSEKARQGTLRLVEGLSSSGSRTKDMKATLQRLGIVGSALLVTREPEENVIRSAHNLPKVWTMPVRLLNLHELLKRETLVITLDAVRQAEELWQAESPRHGARLAATEAVDGPAATADVAPPSTQDTGTPSAPTSAVEEPSNGDGSEQEG